MNTNEPYRATKLWNEAIFAFRNGMPLKKHRYYMVTHNDCFTASEAITWLHCYLINNPNFGPDVTRQQTIQLLQKFLKCHVIESALSKSKKIELSDNSHLYRFVELSPRLIRKPNIRLSRTPLSLYNEKLLKNEPKEAYCKPNNPDQILKEKLPECHFVEKKISLNDIHDIWKKITISRLEQYLPSKLKLSDILDLDNVNGQLIKHNVCRLSKSGVVTLIDKTDDIPHWVISAMKCLANWPNASGSGSCLPNYPGFEKDVFKVVKDFFLNPQISLIPPYLTSALLKVYNIFLKYKKNERSASKNISSLDIHASTDNIKTSTPLTQNEMEINNKISNLSKNEKYDGKILLDDPNVMWDYPSFAYFETEFATIKPITKIVAKHQKTITPKLNKICAERTKSIESISTISVCSYTLPNSNAINSSFSESNSSKSWDSINNINKWRPASLENSEHDFTQLNYLQKNPIIKSFPHLPPVKKSQSFIDYHFSENSKKEKSLHGEGSILNISNSSSKTIVDDLHNIKCVENSCINQGIMKSNILKEKYISANKSKTLFPSSDNIVQNVSKAKKTNLKDDEIFISEHFKICFQMMLLFLPPSNRRQLHLLFRVINKILRNGKFVLNVPVSMRNYLLETFLPAIMHSNCEHHVLYEMTSYILDNFEDLFQPPILLKEEVEENISRLYSGKIKYSLDDTCFFTYCEMISKQQYEEQRVVSSTQALKDLLDNIIRDQNITEKERKKKLKQFKENHPDIYSLRFQQKEAQPRIKNSFFNKFVKLRM